MITSARMTLSGLLSRASFDRKMLHALLGASLQSGAKEGDGRNRAGKRHTLRVPRALALQREPKAFRAYVKTSPLSSHSAAELFKCLDPSLRI